MIQIHALRERRDEAPAASGGRGMAGGGEKLRFAVGVFEDVARLRSAVDDLIDLGLDPRDLCLAGSRAAVERGNARQWAGPSQALEVKPLHNQPTVLAVLAGGGSSWDVDSPVVDALREGGCGCSPPAPGAEVWSAIGDNLRKGALLLMAQLPSAALQDQAVRALLRHSRHPVHAEEFFRTGRKSG
jgi:hypothetical protein